MSRVQYETLGADSLTETIENAAASLRETQRPDGHWIFELEADATIPSEYIFLQHYLGTPDAEEERKIANYLRETQQETGGWPLFHAGDPDISATVKAYYALKLTGESADALHMRRARDLVLSMGGAARVNVFTRISLALFGQVPWRALPVMPVEIMLLPRWFPFNLSRVSYWSRTVIAPLLVLMALKPRARNPRGIGVPELFVTPPNQEQHYITNASRRRVGDAFLVLDRVLRRLEPLVPAGIRRRSIEEAFAFFMPRLNGEDGLGGIFPAMANAVMAMDAMGYPADHPDLVTAKRSVQKLLVMEEDRGYCQPCLSPVWDTALAAHALLEAGKEPQSSDLQRALDWLVEREIKDVAGDWSWSRPGVEPGGWAFQYRNDYYPDVDDTAVVVMAMQRANPQRYAAPIERATRWILAMQRENGGWSAFDTEKTHDYLNAIPFADHGALLDPPTVDVTARCLGMLAQLGFERDHPAVRRGIDYLKAEQEPDGSWYGRWGVNYVYGTWSALTALNAVGEDMDAPYIRKAVAFLKERQQPDGGWGEDCATYWEHRKAEVKSSTASQTAWALLGLMAAGDVHDEAVGRGVAYLQAAPREGAKWQEDCYTGGGFPRVFYLRYHGYSAYFPLWALARYQNLKRTNSHRVTYGI